MGNEEAALAGRQSEVDVAVSVEMQLDGVGSRGVVDDGEVDGLDYKFVTVPEFRMKADFGEFLEFKQVHGNWYATPLTDMENLLTAGRIAILKIDVQGALHAMTLRKDAISIFILPPSQEELEHRIRGRGTDDEAIIEQRLANAQTEISLASKYQHRIVNLDVEMTVAMLERIVE